MTLFSMYTGEAKVFLRGLQADTTAFVQRRLRAVSVVLSLP
jgi:hypothetical protein